MEDQEGGSSNSRQAWKKTRARSRRLRLAIKNSLTSLAHTNVEFVQGEASVDSIDEQSEESSVDEHDYSMEGSACHNIDEAMAALHTLREEESHTQTWKDAPVVNPEYDWILDGDPEWAAEYEKSLEELKKSQQLQHSLEQLELEDPMAALDFDILGRQEHKFANFDDDFFPIQEEEEEFGDFVGVQNDEGDSSNSLSDVEDETPEKKSVPCSPGAEASNEASENDTTTEIDDTNSMENEGEAGRPSIVCFTPVADKRGTGARDANESYEDVEEPRSVYKMLPLADVASPESRFTRRRQLSTRQFADAKHVKHDKEWWCKSEQEMVEDLPTEFYEESFDGTLELLMDLPWEHVAFWQEEVTGEPDIMVVDEHVTQKLSKLDAAQAHVKSRLLCQIQQREDMLEEGNQLLHDMDHNLAMAHMYVHRGKLALDKAHGSEEDFSGVAGMNTLLHDADRRDQLRQLKRVLDKCNKLLETEQSLKLQIESFGVWTQERSLACKEYRRVIQIATQLQKDLDHDRSVSRLVCLDQLRERASTVMESFRSRIDAVLTAFVGRCCHFADSFPSDEYETLLRAMFDVHAHQAEALKVSYDKDLLLDPAQSWSQCILKSLCYEAEKCLARALLDPSDEEATESSYDKELLQLTFELNNGSGDNAKLRTLMHNLVTIRFDFESERNHLARVYHKLCMLLTDVLHAHYVLLQWHRAPFDPRNKNASYLHRAESDEIPEEKKTDEFHSDGISATDGGDASIHAEKVTTDANKTDMNPVSVPQHCGMDMAEQLDRISRELRNARPALWRHCESVLATCLDQHLHFCPKKNFFQAPTDDLNGGERAWMDDLERLHDVFRLTQQFLMVGREFVGAESIATVASLEYGVPDSELREKLIDVFRKHLRVVHVEAMNSTGAMLFHESWKLSPLETKYQAEQRRVTSDGMDVKVAASGAIDKEREAKKCVLRLLETQASPARSGERCWQNRIHKNGSFFVNYLPNYYNWGNPFLSATVAGFTSSPATTSENVLMASHPTEENAADEQAAEVGVPGGLSGMDHDFKLYPMILSFVGDDGDAFPPLGTESAVKGIAKWTWRLLMVMKRLPIILEDTMIVFSNLFDLYFTTVFRLCSGSALHERTILGMEAQNPQEQPLGENGPAAEFSTPGHKRAPSSSSIFGRRRRSGRAPPVPIPAVSQTTEADICAPLLCEREKVAVVRDFIYRGQTSLDGIVNLDKIEQWMTDPVLLSTVDLEKDVVSSITTILEKREGAAWSCLFVAAILDTAWSYAEECFIKKPNPDSDHEVSKISTILSPLESYVESVVNVAPTLATLASRVACSRAVLAKTIVQDIVGVRRWSESNVHVDSNDYIHDLITRNTTTWLFLSASSQPLPASLLNKTWEHLLSASYLAILDGFARVCRYLPIFPPEGIALMSMDIVAFESGISEIGTNHPGCPTSRQRVTQWITALYLPDTDLMQWIATNCVHYQLNHMLALIACRSGNEEKSGLNDMIRHVTGLYKADSQGLDQPPRVKRYHSC